MNTDCNCDFTDAFAKKRSIESVWCVVQNTTKNHRTFIQKRFVRDSICELCPLFPHISLTVFYLRHTLPHLPQLSPSTSSLVYPLPCIHRYSRLYRHYFCSLNTPNQCFNLFLVVFSAMSNSLLRICS